MENSCCCCTCVPSGKVGVIEKLGRFSRLAHPGMNCVVWPVEYMRGTLSTRVQQLDVKTFTKSNDDVTLEVRVAVQYAIINKYIEHIEGQQMHREEDDAAPRVARNSVVPAHIEDHGAYRAFYKVCPLMVDRKYVKGSIKTPFTKAAECDEAVHFLHRRRGEE